MRSKHTFLGNPKAFAWGFFIAFSMVPHFVFSQKVISRSWEIEGLQKLEILSDEAYLISIESGKTGTIEVEAHITGEHAEQIVLSSEQHGNSLRISTSYQPFFFPPNDKLAAHKVQSIALKITVPEVLWVVVSSPSASFEGQGQFQQLEVTLANGICNLINFQGNAYLKTHDADILVMSAVNVSGNAISEHGKVINQLPAEGMYHLRAESVNGNVSLLKSTE